MKKTYNKILTQLNQWDPSVMLTYLPNDSGKYRKIVLNENEENDIISPAIKAAVNEGTPAVVFENNQKVFIEPFYPKERLIILGGSGHLRNLCRQF